MWDPNTVVVESCRQEGSGGLPEQRGCAWAHHVAAYASSCASSPGLSLLFNLLAVNFTYHCLLAAVCLKAVHDHDGLFFLQCMLKVATKLFVREFLTSKALRACLFSY